MDSIGDKFGFTNLRRYHDKFEFYDVFKQDNCPKLDFKRIVTCLYLRSFDARKTRRKSPFLFTGSSKAFYERVDGRLVTIETIKFKQQMEFQSFKIIQDVKEVYIRRFCFVCVCVCVVFGCLFA